MLHCNAGSAPALHVRAALHMKLLTAQRHAANNAQLRQLPPVITCGLAQ